MKFLYYPVIYRHEKYGWTTKLNTIRTTSLIFLRYRIIEKQRSSAVRFSELRVKKIKNVQKKTNLG